MINKESSIKIMRSYDFCHFEVCLTVAHENQADLDSDIRQTSVKAAQLVDRAIERYRASRAYTLELERTKFDRDRTKQRLATLRSIRSAGETLSIDDAAFLRGVDLDPGFDARLEGKKFDYNEWEDTYGYQYDEPFRPTMNIEVPLDGE